MDLAGLTGEDGHSRVYTPDSMSHPKYQRAFEAILLPQLPTYAASTKGSPKAVQSVIPSSPTHTTHPRGV